MKSRRKWPALLEILVKMADIGGQNDPAPFGMDADKLQARGVAARKMHTDARRNQPVAIVEQDALPVVQPNQPADIIDLERVRQARVLHIAAGGIIEFSFLQVEFGGRKTDRKSTRLNSQSQMR